MFWCWWCVCFWTKEVLQQIFWELGVKTLPLEFVFLHNLLCFCFKWYSTQQYLLQRGKYRGKKKQVFYYNSNNHFNFLLTRKVTVNIEIQFRYKDQSSLHFFNVIWLHNIKLTSLKCKVHPRYLIVALDIYIPFPIQFLCN